MSEPVRSTVHVLTGQRLTDGVIVYRTAEGAWSEAFSDGERVDDPTVHDARVAHEQAAQRLIITGIYALEVGLTAQGAPVLSMRERLRAEGASAARVRLGYPP